MNYVGNRRYIADKKRNAGVLLAISITVAFFPLARLAPLINRDGKTVKVGDGVMYAALWGNLIALLLGICGIGLSWGELVHDFSSPHLTTVVSVLEIAAFVPYVTDLVMIGKAAAAGGKAFIPEVYEPTSSDGWFVGAMGMIGAATFCLFLFGAFALFTNTLFSLQTYKPRNATYYRSRLAFYSCVMAIAGLAQLALGAYIIAKFGSGPLPAPITVAMFMVHFPEICVFIGAFFVVNGIYGIFRGLNKQNDCLFSFTMGFQGLCTLILMVGVQTWYAPGGAMAQATPTLANLTLGISLTTTYLDTMGRTLPDDDHAVDEYYGINDYAQANFQDEPLVRKLPITEVTATSPKEQAPPSFSTVSMPLEQVDV